MSIVNNIDRVAPNMFISVIAEKILLTVCNYYFDTRKSPCCNSLTWNLEQCRTDKVEKAMATHSSTLAWKIPWEEPGRLQSMGSLRVGHD